MELTKVVSINTELSDRTLWYDGDSTVPEADLINLISSGISVSGLFVEQISNNIKQYNSLVGSDEQIKTKKNIELDPITWLLPEPFNTLDPIEYVIEATKHTEHMDDHIGRLRRVSDELELYEKLQLIDVLKVLIYIINTLRTNNVVWGVGRGSSVSSYVLYLIGVHDVDSYIYDLDIHDFLHE